MHRFEPTSLINESNTIIPHNEAVDAELGYNNLCIDIHYKAMH